MLSTPREKVLVLREHRVDKLVQDVLSRLAEEVRIRIERFVCLAIEPCDVPHKLFAARARFDQWHRTLLRSGNGAATVLRFEAQSATKRR
jgi:hypothetical protein